MFAHYVKDMKKQINEVKRFQKLAGVIKENEYYGDSLSEVKKFIVNELNNLLNKLNSKFDFENNFSGKEAEPYNLVADLIEKIQGLNESQLNEPSPSEKIIKSEGDIELVRTDKGDYAVKTSTATYPDLDLDTAAHYYFKLTKGVRPSINENDTPTFRPAIYNNRPSITDGTYHYLFGKSKFTSDHSSLYVYDKVGKEVASYDITDEWSSIKQDPTLLAAYKELDWQSNGVKEGIGKALGTGLLGLGLALGSPEKGMAQTKQGIETQTKLKDEEAGDKLWHAYSEHRSTINLSGLSPEVVKAISMAEKEAGESGYPYDAIKKLGQAAKKDQAAMKIINTSETSLRSSSKDAIEAAKRKGLEEVVNEALRKFRKGK